MRKTFVKLLLALAALLGATLATAESWPTKPVRIIVPFVAGGATDVVARLLAQKLTEAWGHSVIVENRAGAGGVVGSDAVAKAAPDGYTLLMASGAIVTNQYMYKSLPFDVARDFVPITNAATGPQVITVGPSVAARDLKEFIAYAKANPGKVNYGSAGVGSQTHLAAENFAYAAGIEITHVPYKGEAAAITDLMGGQIQLATLNLGGAINYLQQGKLRALAVTSRERNPQLPDVPVASDVLPGFQSSGWFGLMAPAGTPREVIDRVARDGARILTSDEFRAKLAQQGMTPVANSPAEFAAAIREESARWAKVIQERHLSAN